MKLPWTTVILAISADGKIADSQKQAARFTTKADLAHLEAQIALNDAVIFGAGTLKAYGTTLSISKPELLQARKNRGQPLQPLQIVCSASGNLDPNWPFFWQSVPRCLLTTMEGAKYWDSLSKNLFSQILIADSQDCQQINWHNAFQQLTEIGYQKIAILGGGELIASLLAEDLINELWLTISPIIIGGKTAPTPVGGKGLFPFKSLQLIEVKQIEQEVFLHYFLL
jgi:5-amino-6-(5-phosphoribosylamino)uracil reductase